MMRSKISRALVDGVDDGREPRRRQDQGRRGASRIGGAAHRDAAVGLLQRRCVVDAVTGHGHHVPAVLQSLHDAVLVLREDAAEAVGLVDALLRCGATG